VRSVHLLWMERYNFQLTLVQEKRNSDESMILNFFITSIFNEVSILLFAVLNLEDTIHKSEVAV
jgi:hypothetical protein